MKYPNPNLLTAILASLAMAATSPAQTKLLFQDDFNAANGTSLTDPASRATGTLASIVKYAWTNTSDVITSDTGWHFTTAESTGIILHDEWFQQYGNLEYLRERKSQS